MTSPDFLSVKNVSSGNTPSFVDTASQPETESKFLALIFAWDAFNPLTTSIDEGVPYFV